VPLDRGGSQFHLKIDDAHQNLGFEKGTIRPPGLLPWRPAYLDAARGLLITEGRRENHRLDGERSTPGKLDHVFSVPGEKKRSDREVRVHAGGGDAIQQERAIESSRGLTTTGNPAVHLEAYPWHLRGGSRPFAIEGVWASRGGVNLRGAISMRRRRGQSAGREGFINLEKKSTSKITRTAHNRVLKTVEKKKSHD